MSAPRILGVFAHPDDEVFCVGGSLAKYAAAGSEAMVVSATRGEAGQIRDAEVATRRTLGTVREQELRAACAALGVRQVRCLDYLDGNLEEAERGELVTAVAEIINEFRPDVVVTFGPDGAYGHPDHIAISDATTEAFDAVLEAGSSRRLYHSHFPRSRLLLVDRLADWLVQFNFGFAGVKDFTRAFSLFAEESTTLRYASDHIEVSWFPPGVYIVEQGEPAEDLYLILSGRVEVRHEAEDGRVEVLRQMGPGQFFGEIGVAVTKARTANVVALDSVTCMVFSPGAPTAFAGRGGVSQLPGSRAPEFEHSDNATTVIDVTAFVGSKIAAIAAHRSQFAIEPDTFPRSVLEEMMGTEYFVRLHPHVEPERVLWPSGGGGQEPSARNGSGV